MRLPDWSQIRALLIALVLIANALAALPAPIRINHRHFDRPDAREEVDSWLVLLASAGVTVRRDELEGAVTTVVNGWIDVRNAVIGRPTRALRQWLGIRQNWALFARPDTWPSALVVEVDGGDHRWSEVYRSLHPDHDLLAAQLRYRRIRGVYDVGDRPGAAYTNLTRWIAAEVFATRPDVTRVRVRLIRAHTTRPGQPSDPARKVIGATIHDRSTVRP